MPQCAMVRMLAILAALALSVPAHAATVTNKDGAALVLTIVEDGSRMELPLDAGATETVCPSGCFVTLPSGDRITLTGSETVEIEGGAALVK